MELVRPTISILTSIIEMATVKFTLMIWPSVNIVMHRKNRLCTRFTGPIPKFDCQWLLVLLDTYHDLEASQVEERLTNLMATFDLTESRYNLISSFSHGMRQKVVVISALLVNPQIWVFGWASDWSGSTGVLWFEGSHASSCKEGNSVLFSTHRFKLMSSSVMDCYFEERETYLQGL